MMMMMATTHKHEKDATARRLPPCDPDRNRTSLHPPCRSAVLGSDDTDDDGGLELDRTGHSSW
jgi:hypothetical protein